MVKNESLYAEIFYNIVPLEGKVMPQVEIDKKTAKIINDEHIDLHEAIKKFFKALEIPSDA